MKTRRFLRFVSGFNGVILMIGLLLGVAAAADNIIVDLIRERRPAVIADIADDPEGKEKSVLGDSRPQGQEHQGNATKRKDALTPDRAAQES